MSSLCVCVCYLPPHGSSRINDAELFFTTLTEQVHTYQNEGNLYICSDFNAHCGDSSDYIEGVDDVSEREVIDTVSNHHGDLLLNFMVDCNMCMLNGRVPGANNFTSISGRGRAVVYYVLVPHEQVSMVTKFDVRTMTDIINMSSLQGCEKVPDHSVLLWESAVYSVIGKNVYNDLPKSKKRFKFGAIPENFLNDTSAYDMIIETIQKIETNLYEMRNADAAYGSFKNVLYNEMNKKLKSYTVQLNNNRRSKGHKSRYKPYWNDTLHTQWDIVCSNEHTWLI